MMRCLLLLATIFALASAGPLLSAVVSSFSDAQCNQASPLKPGLPNPVAITSTCAFYANGPPQAGSGVSVSFQSCTLTLPATMKLNAWPSSAASCVGLPNVVTYEVGVCKAYTDTSGTTLYYKVTCSSASVLAASVSVALGAVALLFAF